MEYIQRSYKLLEETEQSLVALAQKASAIRDYAQAAQLIQLAQELQQLAAQYGSQHVEAPPAGEKSDHGDAPKKGDTRLGRLNEYPKFIRDDKTLVKIGWSKSGKSEYEHKSSKHVLSVLIRSILKVGAKGQRFLIKDIVPLRVDESVLPDYQVYVCLAWLRSLGLVVQHGRQGYSLPKGTPTEVAVEKAWTDLPTR